MPTEHCAFVEKFIELQYFGNYENNVNSINKTDYIFCQSKHIRNYLTEKLESKQIKIFESGHIYYSNWENQIEKVIKLRILE